MNTQPLVHRNGARLFVTSLEISNRFGKRHNDVLRAIESLECSPRYRQRNFAQTVYHRPNPSGGAGIPAPMYEITRDGFVFLCMGFTGAQAAQWKERYIEAFNGMERALAAQSLPAPEAAPPRPPVPVPPAAPAKAGRPALITRRTERDALELFAAGWQQTYIARRLGISNASVSLLVRGKFQFAPGAGDDLAPDALIHAVAARLLEEGRARLADAHQRIAQGLRSSAHNHRLAEALDWAGLSLQQAPARALLPQEASDERQ
ncbi:MAG: Rha family transcriptional regulator [Azoarcus sp.]|jgi:Rha family phage regulatory protein|nr:Rha family transcriptional regulator [Azoarcus sp.]